MKLKDVITKYPQCLESGEKFRAFMMDLYPDPANQARIKVLADVMNCGIVDEIRAGKTDALSLSRYRGEMEKRYGYSAQLIMKSLASWVEAFAPETAVNAPIQPTATPTAPAKPTVPTEKPGQMHVHSFVDTVVPENCREQGYTLHKCACGYEYRDHFIPIGNHQFSLVDTVESTCTTEGRKDYLCAVCQAYKSETVPKAKHHFGEWTVMQAATCEENGYKERRCSDCGKSETATLPALKHDFSKWADTIVATCEKDGAKMRQCVRCGKVEEKVEPATGHKFSQWKKSATREGMWERFCNHCGKTEYTDNNLDNFKMKGGVLTKYIGCNEQVIIPDGVKKIDTKAFENCDFLKSVTIPDSVTNISDDAFDGCGKFVILSSEGSYADTYAKQKKSHRKEQLSEGLSEVLRGLFLCLMFIGSFLGMTFGLLIESGGGIIQICSLVLFVFTGVRINQLYK